MLKPTYEVPFTEIADLWKGLFKQCQTPEEVRELRRRLCQEDLFYLATVAFGRKDLFHPWLYDRCREVQKEPDGHLDLWAREHGKSSLITFALTIQDILNNPEVKIGIFSHTRDIAKAFLRQIMNELERNTLLKSDFDDILWSNPKVQAPKWSENDGLIVRRKSNPKEATVEAWGLVDAMPTGRHFSHRIYDDVVVPKSVSTPEQIRKTTEAWELSNNLGVQYGVERYVGTRYHLFDTYRVMMDRNVVKPRIHPATKDGVDDPRQSVFMPVEVLAEKRKKQGLFTFSAQMLLNPTPDSAQIFARNQLKFWDGLDTENLFLFAMVDPASGKKKHEQRNRQDYTSVWVLGYGPDHNFYVVDIFRDRYALTEKSDLMFEIDYRYGPDLPIFYEEIGLATDTQHIESEMSRRKHRLDLRPIGQTASKDDRIKALQPKFAAGDFIFPPNILRKNKEGKMLDFVKVFIEEEFECYPTLEHDDMLDCLANVNHPEVVTLLQSRPKKEKPEWDAIREAQRKARKTRPLV